MNYVIANHIYACATELGVVVLDSRRGKYSVVPVDRARGLEGVVHGWPVLPWAKAVAGNQGAPSSLLSSLLSGGIVTPAGDSPFRVCKRTASAMAPEALLDALASCPAEA